jgi:hypothetical protein
MCFYEANTTVRIVREYPNLKYRASEFSGIVKTCFNFKYRFSKLENLNTRITRLERAP